MDERELLPARREDAIEAGSRWYFTGEACKNGHVEVRYTINGACKACTVEADRARRKAIRERQQAVEQQAAG